VRHALDSAPRSVAAVVTAADWEERLRDDRERAARNQSPAQREITKTLSARAREHRAEAFALTSSTARGHRTAISDLDYHVVGARPRYDDLPDDVDVYVTDVDRFWSKLLEGDDMVQWTLRFGCILADSGTFREGLAVIERDRIWPDPARQLIRLPRIAALAARLIEMEDEDAALDQVRAGLTSRARAVLLAARVFPLARGELPAQLEGIGGRALAAALSRTIHAKPALDELRGYLGLLEPQ
jgi:hypothetical protein